MSKSKTAAESNDVISTQGPHGFFASKSVRETIESIAIAFVLAFLFRAFEAEAFVIPTGSMAPTLMGRHRDVECEACGYRYQVGNSRDGEVVPATVCPLCRRIMELNIQKDPNQNWYSGDHILVNKFAYDLAQPERWDVIVFKYPGNAKMNFIKRLVGLPNETLRIHGGNVYVKSTSDPDGYHIARKPAHKVLAMMQKIDDTENLPAVWLTAKWPLRWQPWSSATGFGDSNWTSPAPGRVFQTAGQSHIDSWVRFQNVIPTPLNWEAVGAGPEKLAQLGHIPDPMPELVSDFCTYNVIAGPNINYVSGGDVSPLLTGRHWVGDLVLECTAHVEGSTGELLLELVKGGRNYQCRIDVASGEAQLAIVLPGGGKGQFADAEGQPVRDLPKADTKIKGPGTYRLRFSNFDDELRLWINNSLVSFSIPATYVSPSKERPMWSPEEPGDLAPAGVGSNGLAVTVEKLRVYRDVYYIATQGTLEGPPQDDYDYRHPVYYKDIAEIFRHPERWATTPIFDARREADLPPLHADQFLPLGDNSPASKDGRLWTYAGEAEPFVARDLLIGKAMFIYWPHTWWRPMYLPDFQRMKPIH